VIIVFGLMKAYIVFLLFVMLAYIVRHLIFSMSRAIGDQEIFRHDIMDSDLPHITVVVPMHNEEKVASGVLDRLLQSSYPMDRMEIMPINDHSEDGTAAIVDGYAARYPNIRPLHRRSGERGKPRSLNEAMTLAKGSIIVVFDADYLPPRNVVRDIVVCLHDPEVGAVMGRVIPENMQKNLLTRMLGLERSAGYQVDQQARNNLKLTPQYGGTVGAFRKEVVQQLGGFNPDFLTEDTELTFLLHINGWKVFYNNRIECYEEVPEDWDVRARQLRRWSRGHTQVMLKYFIPLVRSPYLRPFEKIDGVLLLSIYLVSLIIGLGILDAMALFYLRQMQLTEGIFIFLAVAAFNVFGNFAPFYQIGTASLLDGFTYRVRLLPFALFIFVYNMFYSAMGALEAFADALFKRKAVWEKTVRYRQS
jgi:cellulose synthase/poly-beta-1,6-N-acetylglucosamine synthase-like glycosyltransferase